MTKRSPLELYSRQYVEGVLAERPSWGSIASLEQILGDEELAPIMSGLPILLGSGPETALVDLPKGFWESTRPFIAEWEEADALREAKDWIALGTWLEDRERAIIKALHAEYAKRVRALL